MYDVGECSQSALRRAHLVLPASMSAAIDVASLTSRLGHNLCRLDRACQVAKGLERQERMGTHTLCLHRALHRGSRRSSSPRAGRTTDVSRASPPRVRAYSNITSRSVVSPVDVSLSLSLLMLPSVLSVVGRMEVRGKHVSRPVPDSSVATSLDPNTCLISPLFRSYESRDSFHCDMYVRQRGPRLPSANSWR